METVDARGMLCPWPAVRLARAMRDAAPGARLRLIADDPRAEGDCEALAIARGWTILARSGDEGLIALELGLAVV